MFELNEQSDHSGTSFEDFCFAAHPFILDPAGKSKLLQYDALNQQQNQIDVSLNAIALSC